MTQSLLQFYKLHELGQVTITNFRMRNWYLVLVMIRFWTCLNSLKSTEGVDLRLGIYLPRKSIHFGRTVDGQSIEKIHSASTYPSNYGYEVNFQGCGFLVLVIN
jgi:hypothetical protein